MKMTLQVTIDEAKSLIKEYKTEVDDVIIVDNVSTINNNYINQLLYVTRIEYPTTYLTSNKIAAIKSFRSRIPNLSLVSAKNSIENVDKAIEFFLRTGQYYSNTY